MAAPGWRGSNPSSTSNPFFEEHVTRSDNPFAADDGAVSREQEVERVLSSYQPKAAAQAFGSPLSSGSLGAATASSGAQNTLQDVPLFDSYSSTSHYATPHSSLASPSSGAWAPNGKGSPGSVPSAALETSAPPAGKKSSALGKLWGGPASPTSAASLNSVPSANSAANASLARREADLKRREAELARREAELRATGTISNKNWPRFWKLAHHDIAGDIPSDRQGLVRLGYFAWCIICAGYIWNFIAITAFWIGGSKKVSLWVFAGLVMVTGVPMSFLTWYRALYWAAMKDGATRWMWYFLHMLVNMIWCVWMVLGLKPNLGGFSAGVFQMIDEFSAGGGKGTVFAIMCIINLVLWGGSFALSVINYGRAMATFRSGPKLPVDRGSLLSRAPSLRPLGPKSPVCQTQGPTEAYNFEDDEGWRIYRRAAEFPPELEMKAKAKYYKREIDPDLDLGFVASKPAPAAQPPPPPRSRAHPAAAARSSTPAPAHAAAPRSQRVSFGEVALLLGHTIFLVTTILAVQPFNRRLSYACFFYACRSSFVVHGYRLLKKAGRPALSPFSALRDWVQRAAASSEAFYLITTVLVTNDPKLWVAFLSPAILAVYHIFATLQPALAGVPLWERYGAVALRELAARREQAMQLMAVAEIGAIFYMVLGAFRVGPRALMSCYVYLNQLRGRFWNPECSAYHARGWTMLGQKVQPVLRAVPALQRGLVVGQNWFQQARPHQR